MSSELRADLRQATIALEYAIQARDANAAKMRKFLIEHVMSNEVLDYSIEFKGFIERAFPENMPLLKAVASGQILKVFDFIRAEIKKTEMVNGAIAANNAMRLWVKETLRAPEVKIQ